MFLVLLDMNKRAWLLFAALIFVSFAFTQTANAAGVIPNGMGQGNQTYTPSTQTKQLLKQKQTLANEFQLVSRGKLSPATFEHDLSAFYQEQGIIGTHSAQAISFAAQPQTASSHILSGERQYSEQKDDYCGPASAESVLNYLGFNYSQSFLAGSSYLKTDQDGGTNYGAGVMAPTLNALSATNFYAQQNVSSLSTYEADMTTDISTNWPVVIAAYETSSYNLNSNEVGWYHWYGVRGYSSYGAVSDYVDPGSGIWNVPAYGTVASNSVEGMMAAGGFGFVW